MSLRGHLLPFLLTLRDQLLFHLFMDSLADYLLPPVSLLLLLLFLDLSFNLFLLYDSLHILFFFPDFLFSIYFSLCQLDPVYSFLDHLDLVFSIAIPSFSIVLMIMINILAVTRTQAVELVISTLLLLLINVCSIYFPLYL